MSNEEIIKALRCCADDSIGCQECPFVEKCLHDLKIAAADALEAAEHRIADLETALAACRIQRGEQLPKGNFWEIVS